MPVPRCGVLAVAAPLLLLVLLLPLDVGPSAAGWPSAPRSVAAVPPVADRPAVRALGVLRRWDRSRAAAYASGDVAALRQLYSPASWAGARDARRLREYVDRGLVVRGLRMQVLEARVLPGPRAMVRLRVVERLAGGTAVTPGSGRVRVALPQGRPTARTITFVRTGQRWTVRSVRRG